MKSLQEIVLTKSDANYISRVASGSWIAVLEIVIRSLYTSLKPKDAFELICSLQNRTPYSLITMVLEEIYRRRDGDIA